MLKLMESDLFEYEYKKDELFYEFDSYFKNNTKNEIEC